MDIDRYLIQETEAKNAIFESLRSGKIVVLGADTSIPNQIYSDLGHQTGTMNLEDGSTAFYLKKSLET